MLTFTPPELKKTLAHSLEVWTKRIGEDLIEGIPHMDEWDDDDSKIVAETTISVSLPEWEQCVDMTCDEFIAFVAEFEKSKLIRGVGCLSPNRALWRVTPVNLRAHWLMGSDNLIPQDTTHQSQLAAYILASETFQHLNSEMDSVSELPPSDAKVLRDKWHEAMLYQSSCKTAIGRLTERRYGSELVHDRRAFKVCLSTGLTLFALHVVESGFAHEYFPPVDDSTEAFVEVTCDGVISESDAIGLSQAYLFELSATTRAEFAIEPRAAVEEDPMAEFSDEPYPSFRLRPLNIGKGMTELLSIYNRAIGTLDDELRILCCAKVVEFVAQSVIRRQSTEALRVKLMSARAISPDAQFISELEALIDQQRVFKKDKEAIKLAVCQCCDATELARHCPPFVHELAAQTLASDPKAQTIALARFADILSATRNSIAHAKANYALTGDECPVEHVSQFADCAKIAAEQVIRWFSGIPESQRVV